MSFEKYNFILFYCMLFDTQRLHQNHQNKDGKAQHELSFELEPLSFPPLPGQLVGIKNLI